jgi:flavin-dependent dehydrogenase
MKAFKSYDVIIVGAGPAGIFTALELADKGMKILMLEKGKDIRDRIALSRSKDAAPREPHAQCSQWLGRRRCF